MRASRLDRKKSLARDYAVGRSRPHLMEVLEPRLLLSADTAFPGITDDFDEGLDALGHAIQEFIEVEPLFDTFVPGLLKPGSGIPGEGLTIADLFRVHNDRNQNDKIGPLDRLLSKFSRDGAHITFEDLFDETFRHRIRTFLDDWDPLTEDPDETNEDDGQFVEEFALFLAGPDIDSEIMGPEMDLEDVMDLEVGLEGYSFDGIVAEWSITFSLGIIHDLALDPGDQSDPLEISSSGDDATGSESIEVTASITLPMTFVFELSGAESEQFFITPDGDMTITVEITEESLLDENSGPIQIFDATFGFLGIEAPGDFDVNRSVTTPLLGPATPDFLGFDVMSLASSSNGNDGVHLSNAMPRGFELDYDNNIFFMLTFTMSAPLTPDVTPEDGDTAGSTDIDALKEGLKNAIDNAIEAEGPITDGSFGADLVDIEGKHDSGAHDNVAAHDDESDDLNNVKSDESQAGADNVRSRADVGINWASDSNGNTVPFSPLGVLHNGRPLKPQLAEFLFALPERGKADLRTDENGDATDELDGWVFVEHTSQDLRGDHLIAKPKFRPYDMLGMLPQTGVPNEPRTDNVHIVAASVVDKEEGLIL